MTFALLLLYKKRSLIFVLVFLYEFSNSIFRTLIYNGHVLGICCDINVMKYFKRVFFECRIIYSSACVFQSQLRILRRLSCFLYMKGRSIRIIIKYSWLIPAHKPQKMLFVEEYLFDLLISIKYEIKLYFYYIDQEIFTL